MKKFASLLLAAALLLSLAVFPSSAATTYPRGDVDLSGSVGSTDLTLLASFVAGIASLDDGYVLRTASGADFDLGDIDLSGEVSASDLTILARHIGGVQSLDLTAASAVSSAAGYDLRDINGDGKIVVACVGDSITAGATDYNWPMFLGEYLTYLGSTNGKKYEVVNCGKGGAAVRDDPENIGSRFYYDDKNTYLKSFSVNADVVIVQMGTNDAAYGNGGAVDSYFVSDYVKYFVTPYINMGAQLFLATPTYDYEHNLGWSDLTNGRICDFVRQIADDYDLPLVDMNLRTGGHRECFPDGLHGNASGYTMIAEVYYTDLFGGELFDVSINTHKSASVSLTDKANNRQYLRTADENGNAVFSFIKGMNYSFDLRIMLAGYRNTSDTLTNVSSALSRSYTLTAETGTDVSPNATAFDSGCKLYEGTKASNINDGERTSGGWQPDSFAEGDYVGLTLDKAYTADRLILYWETASYVSTYADGGYEVWLQRNGSWTQATGLVSAREKYDGDIVMDTVELPGTSVTGVRIVLKNGKTDHKFAPKLYEMQVYDD